MQVEQIIKASADVLTITTLSPGDVYKRVDTDYAGTSSLVFGVVQDVMNNGTDAAVTALEYAAAYTTGVVAKLTVFTGSKSVALFPATPDEVRAHMDDLRRSSGAALDRANEAQQKAQESHAAVVRLHNAVARGDLSAPATVGVLDAVDVTPEDQ